MIFNIEINVDKSNKKWILLVSYINSFSYNTFFKIRILFQFLTVLFNILLIHLILIYMIWVLIYLIEFFNTNFITNKIIIQDQKSKEVLGDGYWFLINMKNNYKTRKNAMRFKNGCEH